MRSCALAVEPQVLEPWFPMWKGVKKLNKMEVIVCFNDMDISVFVVRIRDFVPNLKIIVE